MRSFTIILIVILLMPALILAQQPNIRISGSLGGLDPNEPSVCINQLNTDEILVGANTDLFFRSSDGGLTWKSGVLRSSYGVNCDPAIICDNKGAFYFFHLVPDLSRVVCQKSDYSSSGWSDGSYTALNGTMQIDKEWAAYDAVKGNLYVTWSQFNRHGSLDPRDSTIIFLARSKDGGQNWSERIRISDKGGNASGGFQSVHGSYPATGPSGEVYVCWWSPAGLMFDKSTDEGKTWLPSDKRVTAPVQWIYQVPGMQLTPSFPVIACDRSDGRYRGVIYINWSDNRNGASDSDIWLVKSTDGGSTWSSPKRVNDDPPGKQQYFNFLSVDPVTGYLYILYYDRRSYSDNRTDVYLAVSRDGGSTFENRKISDSPFIPYSTVFFGHYLGIGAYNNVVFATWSRMDNGVNTLWGARVNPGVTGAETYPKQTVDLDQNIPNPFNEYTWISFRLPEGGPVTLKVDNLMGQTVATAIDGEFFDAGKHSIHFDADRFGLSPGIYLFTLVTRDHTVSRKMLFNR